MDLSTDIKYLSCRLCDFDLCHLIWIVGNPTPGSECFHSSLLFASSMTLYNLGNLMLKCSTNQKDMWLLLTNQRPWNCQVWTMPAQWMDLKHFQDTCFVAAWIHIVTIYWILNRYQLPWTRTQSTGLKIRDSICQQKCSKNWIYTKQS